VLGSEIQSFSQFKGSNMEQFKCKIFLVDESHESSDVMNSRQKANEDTYSFNLRLKTVKINFYR
jgi:hypothetical protein